MTLIDSHSCETDCTRIIQLEQHYNHLISRISHDIRNPLTLINSSLQLLESDCPSVHTSELWQLIRQDMTDVINLLHDMSRFAKKESFHLTTFSAYEYLLSLSTSFLPVMEEKGVVFITVVSSLPDSVLLLADPLKIRELLTNLIINSIDALSNVSSPASGSKKIVLKAYPENSMLNIHIFDNGPGIPAEYHDSLFDPYITHKSDGTGMGLSIARKIAEAHGGSLSFTTNTERSNSFTDFCIKLPIFT